MGRTKHTLAKETIIRMAKAAFEQRGVPVIEELTEGMCNTSYRLTYDDGFRTVLKVASPRTDCFLTNECRLMEAEVRAMKLVAEQSDVRVARVYRYDTTRTLCDADYFFMECLEGVSWASAANELADGTRAALHRETGRLQRKLAAIGGRQFGLLGDEEHRFDRLYDFVRWLIANVLGDAGRRNVEIGVPADEILNRLKKDSGLFDAVTEPTLVHWDMWEGNIFIQDGRVTGIIDWERAMWGEPFMDDRFRMHNRNADFLEGFGTPLLSRAEERRVEWYDLLLYLTMIVEVTYREYADDGQVRWVRPLFEKTWSRLNNG